MYLFIYLLQPKQSTQEINIQTFISTCIYLFIHGKLKKQSGEDSIKLIAKLLDNLQFIYLWQAQSC